MAMRGHVDVRVIKERFGDKKEWSVGPGANLRGANFRSVDLRGVDMTGADLSDAIFNGADLSGSRLDRAILRGAVLFQTVLIGASAVGADFQGAALRESELHGADLSDAIIDVGECEAAYGNASTKLPSGRSVNLANRPDEPILGVSSWGGGYRALRHMLDDDAPGQPLMADGTPATTQISEELRADLMASLVRVLDEAIQLSAGVVSRVDRDFDSPGRISWYGSGRSMGSGTPHSFSMLADFLVRHLDVSFEAVHLDGSIEAVFRPAKDVVDSLTRHVLVPEQVSFFSFEDHDAEVTEIDITITSLSHFLVKFESFIESGLESATTYRFFIKPSKRRLHVATIDRGSDEILRIEVTKSQFGQEIAESLWSDYIGVGDDPQHINVADSGWTLEIELEADDSGDAETHPIDEEALREVRDVYKPIAISQCGSIVGFETWEDGLVMAKIVPTGDTTADASVVGASLTDRDALQASLDDAISAYVLTRDLTEDDFWGDDDSGGEVSEDSDDVTDDDEEYEDEVEDDEGSDDDIETDSKNAEIHFEDPQEELAEVIRVLGETRPAVANIWETSEFDYLSGGVLDVEIFKVPDTRWRYMLEAARQGELYLRSCDELVKAFGILELKRLDSHTFKLRMKPCAARRFNLNYEWIPPSSWQPKVVADTEDE